MQLSLDVNASQLKRLIGNCSNDKEIVDRLLKALDAEEMYSSLNKFTNELVGWMLVNITPEVNNRGFSLRSTVSQFMNVNQHTPMNEERFNLAIKMVKERLTTMNLIVEHPNHNDKDDGDLWKFGEYQPKVFTDLSNYRFAHTFSQFK